VSRSLALPNSFSLTMTNNSSSTFTFSLFNLGGGFGTLQTPITSQQSLNTILNLDISAFVDTSGNCTQLTDIVLYTLTPSFTLLGTVSLAIGQNILTSQISLNPVVGTNGLSGVFQISYSSPSSKQIVNIAVGSANAQFFRMTQFPGPAVINEPFQTTTSTFVTTNPLVTLGGTIPFNEILNSETGNAYKVDGVDVITNNSNQTIQTLTYGFRDANGNRVRISTSKYVDIYQPQSKSLQNTETIGFIIDYETLFTYPVLSYTFVRLTFNYVRAQVSIMKEFDLALAQEFVYESNKLYKELELTDGKRYILYQ
jgi:hypothetical protein